MELIKKQLYYLIPSLISLLHSFLPSILKPFLYALAGFQIKSSAFLSAKIKFLHVGRLQIGNNTMLNPDILLDNRHGIKIGNNVSIARNCRLITLGHEINSENFKPKGAEIVIDDYSVLFMGAYIMPGVRIAEGSVILANSVVTKDTEKFGVYGGSPARLIKFRDKKDYKYNPVIKSYFLR